MDHLLKNSYGGNTPPRKRQSRGPPLSPVNDNQRSAISEIARAQRPMLDHMSPKTHSHMHRQGGGVGREGEDDETQNNENEVVDLGDEAPYVIPCTQLRKGNDKNGKGKGIVVIDSQSAGEETNTEVRGALLEEFERHRPRLDQGEEDRGKKSKIAAQSERRRQEKSWNGEDDVQKTKNHIYIRSEEEEDDSDTKTLSLPRRSEKTSAGTVAAERVPAPTQTYRRQRNSENAPSTQPTKGVGVAATEVPATLRPRKNGVRQGATFLFWCVVCHHHVNTESSSFLLECFECLQHSNHENIHGICFQYMFVYELGTCVRVQVPLRFNTQCWLLHPEFPGRVVAAGRAGVYGKSRARKHKELSEQCETGNQMVQVTDVFVPLVTVLFDEERHGLEHLEDAAVPHAPRDTWLKWVSNYLIERPRTY